MGVKVYAEHGVFDYPEGEWFDDHALSTGNLVVHNDAGTFDEGDEPNTDVIAVFPADVWKSVETYLEPPEPLGPGRVWERITDVPPGVCVSDPDGDIWTFENGWGYGKEGSTYRYKGMYLNDYPGPFVEVLDA